MGHRQAKEKTVIQESLMLREMAQTNDGMTIYISRAEGQEDQCRTLLQAVGYWGQTSSLAQCTIISQTAPVTGEYAVPVSSLDTQHPLASYFLCFASEFRDEQCSWKEVVEEIRGREEMLQLDVYAWPLIITHQQKAGKILTWPSTPPESGRARMRTGMHQHTHNIPKRQPKDKHPFWRQLGKNCWAPASLMDEFERIICTGPKYNFFWVSAVGKPHSAVESYISAVEMCL